MRQTAEDTDLVYSVVIHNDGRFLTRYINRQDPIIQEILADVSISELAECTDAGGR